MSLNCSILCQFTSGLSLSFAESSFGFSIGNLTAPCLFSSKSPGHQRSWVYSLAFYFTQVQSLANDLRGRAVVHSFQTHYF